MRVKQKMTLVQKNMHEEIIENFGIRDACARREEVTMVDREGCQAVAGD